MQKIQREKSRELTSFQSEANSCRSRQRAVSFATDPSLLFRRAAALRGSNQPSFVTGWVNEAINGKLILQELGAIYQFGLVIVFGLLRKKVFCSATESCLLFGGT